MRRDTRTSALVARQGYARLVAQVQGWSARQARGHGRVWRRPLRVAEEDTTLVGPWHCCACNRQHLHHVGRCLGCGVMRSLGQTRMVTTGSPWLDRGGVALLVALLLSPVYLVAGFHWALGWWPFTPSVSVKRLPPPGNVYVESPYGLIAVPDPTALTCPAKEGIPR